MDGALNDDEAARLQQGTKVLVRRRLLSIDPHYEYSGGAKEVHKPIERSLKSAERAPPPIDERNVILAGGEAAISRRRCAEIAAALQFHHHFHAP